MADEARLDVVIGSDKAVSGGNAVNRAIDSIKNNFLELSAKVYVAEHAIEKLWSIASKGAQFEETLARLNRQMAGFNSTGQLMVSTLQNITSGTLGVDRAATMASRALAVGLNPDQVKTFTEAAMLLKNVMGTELPQAFDEIVNAAISGRAAILGNIGVFVDLDKEVRQLAVSTGRTTEQITKQEKAMLTAKAVTEQIGDASRRLTDGMLSDADRLKQVEARWENLWTKIGQDAKTGVLAVIDALDKLDAKIDIRKRGLDLIASTPLGGAFMRGAELLTGKTLSPRPDLPDGTHYIGLGTGMDMNGREMFGPPNPGTQGSVHDAFSQGVSSRAQSQLPTSLQGAQIDADRARKDQILAGDLDRIKAGLAEAEKLYESDAQRQLITQEELVNAKGVFQLRELAAVGQKLNKELELENQSYAQRTKVGFESTEEKITEENRHKDEVVRINQELLTNTKAFGAAAVLSTQQNEQAKEQAIEQSAKRNIEHWSSVYAIQERLRQQDIEDAKIYYQGEMDLANALYAGDDMIAQKERALMREQLAFKLRITQEEVDRLLFLRKSGDVTGAYEIAGSGGTQLNSRAIQGIVDSSTANDIRLAERANNDFFAGWARGLQKYAQDRDSAFGMSTDMARRVAQGMEQSFQQFFFKGISGEFQSFKDVLQNVLDFTKQIISQIAAQMVTVGIINPAANNFMRGMGSLFASGAENAAARGASNPGLYGPGFADGGTGNFGSGTPTMLHGVEGIVPLPDGRSIPVMLRYAGVSDAAARPSQVNIQVINNAGADVGVERTTDGDGKEQIRIMIQKAVDSNLASGRHDKALGSRYKLSPGGG